MTVFTLGRVTLESRKVVGKTWILHDDATLRLRRQDEDYCYLAVEDGKMTTYLHDFEAMRRDSSLAVHLRTLFEALENMQLVGHTHDELKDHLALAMEGIFMPELTHGFRTEVSGAAADWPRWRVTVVWDRRVVPFMPPEDSWLAEPYVGYRIRQG